MFPDKSIFKITFTPQPQILPPNREWIRSLQVGDIIETNQEQLIVVRGCLPSRKYKSRDVVLVKRQHLKRPITLRSCEEFDHCIEITWSIHDAWKQIEYSTWRVIKSNERK